MALFGRRSKDSSGDGLPIEPADHDLDAAHVLQYTWRKRQVGDMDQSIGRLGGFDGLVERLAGLAADYAGRGDWALGIAFAYDAFNYTADRKFAGHPADNWHGPAMTALCDSLDLAAAAGTPPGRMLVHVLDQVATWSDANVDLVAERFGPPEARRFLDEQIRFYCFAADLERTTAVPSGEHGPGFWLSILRMHVSDMQGLDPSYEVPPAVAALLS